MASPFSNACKDSRVAKGGVDVKTVTKSIYVKNIARETKWPIRLRNTHAAEKDENKYLQWFSIMKIDQLPISTNRIINNFL